jgi:chromosome segregation ATPase
VTILAGRNATNRTSFLQALMAAFGSDNVSIKGDAEEARVELTVGEETYTRTLERTNGHDRTDGDLYLDDATFVNLFAFLLESNEARQAVARNDDLRNLIMRPIDTEEIQAEIDRLLEERRRLEEELEEIESLKDRRPSLEEKQRDLEAQIEATREELAAKEAELDAADAEVEQSRAEKDELEEKLSKLNDRRSALDDVRYNLETERETIDRLHEEQRDLEDGLAELPDGPGTELEDLDAQIDQLRTRKQRLEADLNEVQSIIGFNEELVEDSDADILDMLRNGARDGAVKDELLADETVTCWTCGSEVETAQIEATIDRLRDLSTQKLGEINDIESELDALTDRRLQVQREHRERERIERRLAEIETELEDSEAAVDQLAERREDLTDEIAAIENEVEELDDDSYGEVLELHREANQLEYDFGQLESDLEDVEDEITEIEGWIDEQAALERQREDLQEDVETLRNRIDRIEQQAVEEFNEHMDQVLELLDHQNLDRIWLERVEREVRDGRRTATTRVFELHVVRSTASGTAYEDTVDHLSESEREVTGLVFTLAGYLAHDVHEEVPFMLLDSLEAIDAERIATFVEYLEDYTDYLVVALLEGRCCGAR